MSPPDPGPPALPRERSGAPVFAEVWQARAFALATLLSERGVFPWPTFAAALAAEIARDPDADYHAAWLRALEAMLAAHGIAPPVVVAATTRAWQDAARATPHGAPIRLDAVRAR